MNLEWPSRRLKQVAGVTFSTVDKKRAETEHPVLLCNYTDVYYNRDITSDLPFMEATASLEEIHRFTLRAGDTLVTKDSETPDDIGVPAFVPKELQRVVCGYHLALVRPNPNKIHPRFLFWVLESKGTRQRLEVSAAGVTRYGLRFNDVRNLPVPAPPVARQQAIADFLDRETARLDQLVRRKEDLIRLTNERRAAYLTNAVLGRLDISPTVIRTNNQAFPELPEGWHPVRLRQAATDITVGIVVRPSELYADEGLPFVRGYNVQPGFVNDRDLARIAPETNRRYPKSTLRSGDVLVVRTGQAGAAAVIPEWAVGGNCVDVLVVRSGPTLRPTFLELVLNSEHAARQVRAMSVGAIQSHFNVGALRNLVLPLPPLREQDRILHTVGQEEAMMSRLVEAVDRQVQVLAERRQALITVAVTGAHESAQPAA